MSTAPLFISILTPHAVKSSFCAGIQFSRDPIRGFDDGKKYEKIEGCEQSEFLRHPKSGRVFIMNEGVNESISQSIFKQWISIKSWEMAMDLLM